MALVDNQEAVFQPKKFNLNQKGFSQPLVNGFGLTEPCWLLLLPIFYCYFGLLFQIYLL